jgi:hypothetical protein
MKALRVFAALPPKDRKVVFGLLLRLISAELRMTFLPYSFTRKLVFRERRRHPAENPEALHILRQHLVWLKRICDHLPWDVTCLRKAIALRDALYAAGVDSVVRFGMGREKSAIIAHAWLECCGYEILKNGTYSEFLPIG